MLKLLTRSLKRPINVYEGVSPSLLATMSLSANIKGENMEELAHSLHKAGLVPSQAELQAWKTVDRALFSKSKHSYLNKPCPISKGQNMTDVFTHAVIVSSLAEHWCQNMTILDVGTGHGFLPFLISKILKNKQINNYHIKGIDIYDQNINKCKQIQVDHFSNDQRVSFEATDLESFLEREQNKYDAIIGGFYLEESMTDWLAGRIKEGGVGVWPTRSEHGQALYKLQPNKEKVYLIQTLFSMPVVRTSVSKYFIEKDDEIDEGESPSEVVNTRPEELLKIRKQMEQKLKDQLKLLLDKHRCASGKLLSLSQMKQIPEIKAKLDELQKLPKTKIKVPK